MQNTAKTKALANWRAYTKKVLQPLLNSAMLLSNPLLLYLLRAKRISSVLTLTLTTCERFPLQKSKTGYQPN